jgi:hypothetical protein
MFLLSTVGPYGVAIISAVAAVIGGALAAGSNLLATSFSRRHQDEAEQRRAESELRQAARLILEELAEVEQAIQSTAKTQLTWRSGERQLPAFAWSDHRHVLAAQVPDDAWRLVAAAYRSVNELNWHVIGLQREFKTDGPVHFIDKSWLQQPFRTIRVAIERLDDLVGPKAGIYAYSGYVSTEELEELLWPELLGAAQAGEQGEPGE